MVMILLDQAHQDPVVAVEPAPQVVMAEIHIQVVMVVQDLLLQFRVYQLTMLEAVVVLLMLYQVLLTDYQGLEAQAAQAEAAQVVPALRQTELTELLILAVEAVAVVHKTILAHMVQLVQADQV